MIILNNVEKILYVNDKEYSIQFENFTSKDTGLYLFKRNNDIERDILFSLISGHSTPDRGEIVINGKSIMKSTKRTRVTTETNDVCYLENTLLLEKTISYNLGLNKKNIEIDDFKTLLLSFDLFDKIYELCLNLSYFERIKVAIVKSIVSKSKIVLANIDDSKLRNEEKRIILDTLFNISKVKLIILSLNNLTSIKFDVDGIIDGSVNIIEILENTEKKHSVKKKRNSISLSSISVLNLINYKMNTIFIVFLYLIFVVLLNISVFTMNFNINKMIVTNATNGEIIEIGHTLKDNDFSLSSFDIEKVRSFSSAPIYPFVLNGNLGVRSLGLPILEVKNDERYINTLNLDFIIGTFPSSTNEIAIPLSYANYLIDKGHFVKGPFSSEDILSSIDAIIGKKVRDITTLEEKYTIVGIYKSTIDFNTISIVDWYENNPVIVTDGYITNCTNYYQSGEKVRIDKALFIISSNQSENMCLLNSIDNQDKFSLKNDYYYDISNRTNITHMVKILKVIKEMSFIGCLVCFFIIIILSIVMTDKTIKYNDIYILEMLKRNGFTNKKLLYIYLIQNFIIFVVSLPFSILVSIFGIDLINNSLISYGLLSSTYTIINLIVTSVIVLFLLSCTFLGSLLFFRKRVIFSSI